MVSALEAAGLAALLVVGVLPVAGLLGIVLFVPWEARYWSLAHARRVLGANRRLLAAMVGIIGLFVVQSQLDPLVTRALGWDFTPHLAAFDGDLHARIQAAMPPAVVVFLAVVYLAGFPLLVYLAPIVALWLGDGRAARRAFAVFAVLYAIALPFYFLMPVREVWTTGRAENLALVLPHAERLLYAFNDVNNCFPSMHTAMAIGVAAVMWTGPSRAFAITGAVLATLIAASTIALGIHWTLDVVAGLVAAAVAVAIVRRIYPPAPAPTG